jgi:hypothetical protein
VRGAAIAWDLWRTLCGIGVIAVAMTFALMWSLSDSGPVVEVKRGPVPGVIYARVGGTLSYVLTTVRHQSCPGVDRWQFIRVGAPEDGFDAHAISGGAPVDPKNIVIGESRDALIERHLPPSVYPGRWLYRHTLTSRCPTGFERVEVLSEFEVEVVPTVSPEG